MKSSRFTPLIVTLGIVLGILLGMLYANHFSGNRLNLLNSTSDKLNTMLYVIDDQYVDSVSIPDLIEKSLPQILAELDPHSAYIPAAEAEASMEDLKGSFSGIGIQFMIYRDTVRIVRVISGGPSEKSGLRAGDRIVSVDGKPYVGEKVDSDETMKRLKGKAGTSVRLGIARAGEKGVKNISVKRGDVPLQSIDAVYMADSTTGYIRINNFGSTTYAEFLGALATLSAKNFQGLIIDLRGNLGGYMEPAIQIANEFLTKNNLIVYTEGRKSPRKDYRSDGRGSYPHLPLVVLVDESSASASEILAGAIQDNDRGTIVGRRTFGKGLVQEPIEFKDGSMLRLTKARYYTPSGRSVQKPYTPGDPKDYEMDLLLRAEHGEYFSADSIKTNGPKFTTTKGRTVYGGGGIIPDIFIPRDTMGITSYFKEAYLSGMLSQFAYDLTDRYRQRLEPFTDPIKMAAYLQRQGVVEDFARFAERGGLKRRNLMIRTSRELIESHILTGVVSNMLGTEPAIIYANTSDPTMVRALLLIKAGEAFPTAEKDGKQTARAAGRWWRKSLLSPGHIAAAPSLVTPFGLPRYLCHTPGQRCR